MTRIGAILVVAWFVSPQNALADTSEKLGNLLFAISAKGHCDLELHDSVATDYYVTAIKAIRNPKEGYETIKTMLSSQLVWGDPTTRAELCSDLVKLFGVNGSEKPGMMTGTGKPTE